MKGIVNEFELIVENDIDEEIAERIESSLLIINIPNSFTEIDEETYLTKPRAEFYSKEDYIITKIIDGEEEYQRYKREIERAKQRMEKTTVLCFHGIFKLAFVFNDMVLETLSFI